MLAPRPVPNHGPSVPQLDGGAVVTGGLLVILAAIAWVDLILNGAPMPGASMAESGAMNVPVAPVTALVSNGLVYLIAWGVMMAAMMLPSAAPMIALYGSVSRNRDQYQQQRVPTTALFALVYLALWVAVGIPIYGLSLAVDQLAATSPTVNTLRPVGIAVVLVAAGLFQLTPWKRSCLHVCRGPLAFLLGHWRPGFGGALRLGLLHALACLGCCWALMLVLVTAGAMGLPWVLLIAVVVFAEKVLPYGDWTARITGSALVLFGIVVAIQPGLLPGMPGAPM